MNHPQKPTWYILGPGAIGSLWASYFKLSGFPVVLITQSVRNTNAIALDDGNNQHLVDIEQVTLTELVDSKQLIHNLLITTKAQHTVSLLQKIAPHIANNAILLVIQNGMAAKEVQSLFPNVQLTIGITTDGAYRTDTCSVVHAGKGVTSIGNYQNIPVSHELLTQLPSDFLVIEPCEDIELRQWKKLAINCLINGLTAIYNCKNGDLLNIPTALEEMNALSIEVAEVCHALEFKPQDFENLYQQALHTITTTGKNYSSMYQDIHQNRKTEIDYINGYLIERARQLGVSCPENIRIVKAVKALEESFDDN
ncbi:MAG: 2-dehydropantoate 2-reductase [Oceanicoccus sp.]